MHPTKQAVTIAMLAAAAGIASTGEASAQKPSTPFPDGTVYVSPNILTSKDPSEFASIRNRGRGDRMLFDFRFNREVKRRAFLYTVRFTNGQVVRFRVNPEFGRRAATTQSRKYARYIGQIPRVLRKGIKTVTINRGPSPLAANESGDLTITTGSIPADERTGFLEEAFLHESGHTTLDERLIRTDIWKAAQRADPLFISDYARDNRTSEDVAESLVPWLIVRYRANRVDPAVVQTIRQAIPFRLAVLDALKLDLRPWVPSGP